jgi:hypothetical protein
MASDWYLSEQAGDSVQGALDLARERRHGWLGAEHLLVAVLRRWDDERVGGVALLRACGLTGAEVPELVTDLLNRGGPVNATPVADPRATPAIRFALAQAVRIAAEAHDAYVGTEHLVLALLWQDCVGELRLRGVSYTRAARELPALPRLERPAMEPLGAAAVLARQVIDAEPDRLLDRAARRDELPLDGWTRFEVDRGEWHAEGEELGGIIRELLGLGVRLGVHPRGERFGIDVHPGPSGLEPRAILERVLGRRPTLS